MGYTDFLRGVDVFAETVLEVMGDKPQKLKWAGYGFFIEVPEGALPPGVHDCQCGCKGDSRRPVSVP